MGAEPQPVVLPWHRETWEGLQARIGTSRLHHALLLSGPQGIGKRQLAGMLAGALLCTGEQIPCGVCRSCTLLRAGTHPDGLRVVPEEPGRQIRIAQVREDLIDFVGRTASMGARKVVLIDPADAMNTATANCLLKSLEEPAAGTHLLLVTDAPVRLLPTIRSRCEHLRLRPPARPDGLAWLRALGAGDAAEDLLGAGADCPLRAEQLLRSGGLEQFDQIAALMRRALDADAWIPLVASGAETDELRSVLAWMQILLGDFARWLADPSMCRIGRARPVYESLGARVDARHVARTLREVTSLARDAASSANPNRQLALESLLTRWGMHDV